MSYAKLREWPLSPRMKQVYELRERGLSYREIADALEISVSNVAARLAECKRRTERNYRMKDDSEWSNYLSRNGVVMV